MSKVLLIDVDGTLTNYENQIPQSAIDGIRQVRANQHKVYMCTGRSRAEIPEQMWDIGFDGLIGGNGSYVEHQGQVVMHQTYTLEQCERVVDWLNARQLSFYLESNEGLFASKHFKEDAKPVMIEYQKRKGKELTDDESIHGMIYGEKNLYRENINKISFILKTYQDHLDSKIAFPDLEANTWGGAGETALFGDLGVKGINKATAIDVLLAHIGGNIADTIAFGDAAIDIPMFEHCAVSVAMGSGGQGAKEAADYVTDAVDDDGLYHAFKHLKLI